MVLACDITIDGKRNAGFVLYPNALYVSNDNTLSSVATGLAWCLKCAGFCAAERIEPAESTRSLLAKSMNDELPEYHEFIFQNDPDAIAKFQDSLRRTLHWLSLRQSPPRCLQCSTTDIQPISEIDGVEFIDNLGRTCSCSHGFASTSIDHRLSVYDTEGNLLAEISRICPETSDYIDDAYSHDKLMELVASAKDRNMPSGCTRSRRSGRF